MNTELRFAAYSSAPSTAAVDFCFFKKGSYRRTGLRKMFHHNSNKKEQDKARAKDSDMSRLCCSFSFEPLNPEWLPIGANSLSALWLCVCARKRRQRECVHAYISSSNPSFHRLSTPQYCTLLSSCPISLFPFRPHPGVSPGQIFTLLGGCLDYLFLSACLVLFSPFLLLALQSMSQSISCSALSVFWTGCQSVC